jgi:hypothetical protein
MDCDVAASAEVGTENGQTTLQVCKETEIPVQSYYRRSKEYDGM